MASLCLNDILTTPVITVDTATKVHHALEMMRKENISALVVMKDAAPSGIFTERDAVLIAYKHHDPLQLKVEEVMGKPLLTAPPDLDYRDGYRLINEKRVRHLVVTDEQGGLVGIVTEGDFLKHLGNEFLVRFKEVGAVMNHNVLSLPSDAQVDDAVRMMTREHISCVVIEEQGKPVGIFTERDLVRLETTDGVMPREPLSQHMSQPVNTVKDQTPLPEALRIMDDSKIRRLVVVDQNSTITGLVTRHDVVKQLYNRHVEILLESLRQRELELAKAQTELKAERELHRTEERLAESQRLAHIGCWELNLSDDTLWWSDETFRIFEIDPERSPASYQAFIELVHPDDREKANQTYRESLANHTQYNLVHRLLLSDGRVKYVNERCRTYYDEAGKPLRSVGTVQDITDSHLRQQERDRLHALVDALMEGSSDAIFVKNRQGQYILVNQALVDLMDKPREEVIGADDYHLFPADQAERFLADDQRTMQQGKTKTYEEQVVVGDKTLPYQTTKGPLVIDGEVIGVFGIARDITSLKQAEEQLRKNENLFRSIFEQAAVGVALIDSTSGRFLRINQRYCDMVGYTLEEMSGSKTFQQISHPDDLQENLDNMARLLAGEIREFSMEKRYFHRDGSIVWVNLTVSPTWEPGQTPKNHIAVVEDITERKNSEISLRESRARLLEAERLAHMGNWELDAQTGKANWSRQIHEMLGTDPSMSVGTELLSSLVNPNDWPEVKRSLESAIQNGTLHEMEYRIKHQNGEERWLFCKAERLLDEQGNPLKLTGIAQDVTERKLAEMALQESEKRFRATFDQAAVGIARVSTDGRWVEANEKLCEIVGRTRDELIDKRFQDITYSEDIATELELFQEVLAGDTDSYAMDKRCVRRSGDLIWVRLTVSPVRASDGTPLYLISVIEDIDARKKAEEKLREAAAVFRSTGEGVTITDVKGNILDVNDAFCRITGYSREEVIGMNPRVLKSGRHDADFYRDMWEQIQEQGHWHGEIWNRAKNGIVYPEILTISTVESDQGELEGFVGVFADISSLKATEARLDYLAHHDPLTELPNRLLFRDRLVHSLASVKRYGTKVAVVFFDVDHFKNINDTMGHSAGDRLLIEIAQRIRKVTRQGDSLGRISGDEFCLILEGLHSVSEAAPIVEKLIHVLERPFTVNDHTLRVSASIGVAICPDNSEDADALLSFADAAMYEAKEAGRNTYRFYTKEMTKQALEQSFVQSTMRDALDKSHFFLVYQPQVDLQSGTLVGLETLIRWQHPIRGLIPPGKFIPIAEQGGLIRELGSWILRTACTQARTWLDEGRDFGRIFVNVAGPQLHEADFPQLVRQCLLDTGLPADRLGLEVTEGFVMRASEHAVETLIEIRGMGIELAIDDFGTGYSSLSYLKKLPISKLKIDQSFIRDIPDDKNDMAIAEAVIAMGRALDMKVIAEGVETPEQAAFVRSKGCQEGQGYLFSHPLPPDDIGEAIPILNTLEDPSV